MKVLVKKKLLMGVVVAVVEKGAMKGVDHLSFLDGQDL
jgi:hypothetical protein